ncbi:MAG TPA: sigma-54-dependent Fis family transcriptional regulator [Caldithrix abyssi]|uniref:Sigma-54-dependent Fis family transcriptional regulator n=1 Tax=Caldithrix abyssi TaxID=187145 RepID=A0A7V4U2U7_CALAY|nr:sigma-54-dependent Fis family transcriptional regulator [Caldithrix abyssi]
MQTTILMIDDDPFFLNEYAKTLKEKYQVHTAQNILDGLDLIEDVQPNVLLLDISLNSAFEGLEALPAIKEKFPWLPVIMVTNHDSHTLFKHSRQHGADEYFVKSSSLNELKKLIYTVLIKYKAPLESEAGVIVESPLMKKVFSDAARAAKYDNSILLVGPSGSGKEVLARYIHRRSDRKDGPFIAVNCGALVETLVASELFGHKKGAFTGALTDQIGKIEQAQGGTLFLDELEDLSPQAQAALLRALQEKKIQRLGGARFIDVDFRLISAVKSDLLSLIQNGHFREDLYYRIGSFVLFIPSLKDREEEIIPLAYYFLREFCKRHNITEKEFTPKTLHILKAYHWPGNVRELKNVIERAVMLSRGKQISPAELQIQQTENKSSGHIPYIAARNYMFREFRKEYIKKALLRNNGNISKTAQDSGLSRRALQNMIKELGL